MEEDIIRLGSKLLKMDRASQHPIHRHTSLPSSGLVRNVGLKARSTVAVSLAIVRMRVEGMADTVDRAADDREQAHTRSVEGTQ